MVKLRKNIKRFKKRQVLFCRAQTYNKKKNPTEIFTKKLEFTFSLILCINYDS